MVVVDGLGIGAAPDAVAFGDAGADTLASAAAALGGLRIPVLQRLGLGIVARAVGLEPVRRPAARAGRLAERSAATDSATGHRELMGLVTETPPPTYPTGFPAHVMQGFAAATGRGWLCNAPGSGTEVLERFGAEHMLTGALIVYTSADSVFQVAAHEDVVPPRELYAACAAARGILTGSDAVDRVIARPFTGVPGGFTRTAGRRDLALPPRAPTALDALAGAGVATIGVGKVCQLMCGRGVAEDNPTRDDADGVRIVRELVGDLDHGLVVANLFELDTRFGHRRDPIGYGRHLEALDALLGGLLDTLRPDDLLILTADHGNDPGHAGSDHTREWVPMLARVAGAEHDAAPWTGEFGDVGQTVLAWFGVRAPAELAGRPVPLPPCGPVSRPGT